MVHDDQRAVILPRELTQEIRASQQATRITLRMDEEVEGDGSNPQGLGTMKKTPQTGFDAFVRNKEDQILAWQIRAHPRTPAANSVPRVVSCFQDCNAGCSLPRTMFVAPSRVLEKQRTCLASTVLRITGEWVASSTWAS